MIPRNLSLNAFAICLVLFGRGLCADEKAPSYFLIGNSLTWDTIPSLLDGDVQWHVACGKSLPFIDAHPEMPCVKSSTLWPQAFKQKQYDVVSVQPHYGSTLQQDVATISKWMTLQPRAVFVIHSGWAHHASREEEFANDDPNATMQHSPAYFRALTAELRRLHPGRQLRQARAIQLLAKIAEDMQGQRAAFQAVTDLHRDPIHMKHETGKYLMHNAMRIALGQPLSSKGFDQVDSQVKAYLTGVLGLLSVGTADRAMLGRILSLDRDLDRGALTAMIQKASLRKRLSDMLPAIESAIPLRRRSLKLQAEIEDIGGRIYFSPSGPKWLYLTADDAATDLFQVPTTIDLYNGNNPLKGRGGRNERVTDGWLANLSGLTSLKKLDVANCQIKGDGLQHVGTLAGLRELNLTLTPVTDDGLVHLGKLTELRKLGLASTQCMGTGFAHLTALKKLESVNFHFTPLNDAGLREIAKISISDRLWFAHTHFTDRGAESLKSLTQLRRCGIGSKDAASSGEAVASLANLPLEDLALLDNQASPVGLAHASRIKTLLRLDASYAPKVGDAEMKLLAKMPRLQELLKIGSAQVTDDGLQALASLKSLKKLTLSGMKHITEAGVARLRDVHPKLVIVVQ
ncbi:MAG: hypothetical protein O3A00_00755 [Planctomycetota bacterium]|nr:hypothetical protein [Planctomycetota bacterium]